MGQNNLRVVLVCACGSRHKRELFANNGRRKRCHCGRDIPVVNTAMKNDLLCVRLGDGVNGRMVFSGRLKDLSGEFQI